ncbi:hypothetical protein [Shewanella violacea]|uniref:Uncharacterized protein n=1 Tax=Shewanella violacea (strain JCM 10179 / CIP 106290 / LMG 19151 / DSS12) TaxID=637905 RepID=D4ZGU9_SHEVD|nr:hypothetical protein [Shewanella violacea]BAJ00898.1 conserved hypothetical protein [Shewanella violacea DSS12]
MRVIFLVSVLSLGFTGAVQAEQLQACNQDIESVACQHYLEGVVDGAMMYKPNAAGARIETDSFESRALKYRSGKRFQEANRTYCENRIPNRHMLVRGLAEAFSAGTIQNVESLKTVMQSLMDCQRLK